MIKIYVDLGTTNLKIEVYKKDLLLEKYKSANTEIYFDSKNQIDCEKIITFFNNLINKLILKYESEIKIIFSSAMHTLIFLNNNGNFIRNGNTLLDPISENKKELPFDVREINGLVPGWFLPIYKINEFAKTNDISRVNSIMTLKSYILYRLCDVKFIEISDAAGLGLIDYRKRTYSQHILEKINVRDSQLPQIVSGFEEFESKKYSKKVYFCLGLSDGAAAAYNEYLNSIKNLSLSIGTTLGIRKVTEKIVEPKFELDYCFPILQNHWVYGISSSNGGNNLELALKHSGLTFSQLNIKNFEGVDSYREKINFFSERNGKNRVSKIDDFKIDDKLFFTLLKQIVDNVFDFKTYIDIILSMNTKLSCTGGVFENPTLIALLKSRFDNKFEISQNSENLSIEGLKKLFK